LTAGIIKAEIDDGEDTETFFLYGDIKNGLKELAPAPWTATALAELRTGLIWRYSNIGPSMHLGGLFLGAPRWRGEVSSPRLSGDDCDLSAV